MSLSPSSGGVPARVCLGLAVSLWGWVLGPLLGWRAAGRPFGVSGLGGVCRGEGENSGPAPGCWSAVGLGLGRVPPPKDLGVEINNVFSIRGTLGDSVSLWFQLKASPLLFPSSPSNSLFQMSQPRRVCTLT